MSKRSEINRRQFSNKRQSWFSKYLATWANNHGGWSKMKKKNRKIFKKKYRKEIKKEIQMAMEEYDG